MTLTPFHVAIPVRNLAEARAFYTTVIGCTEGRSAGTWADFNLFGHQFVCHVDPTLGPTGQVPRLENPVDGKGVPIPHYGVVLTMPAWRTLADRLRGHDVDFVIEPYIRFESQVGEQATMFLLDPSGNALEFKGFDDMGQLFAS